MTAATLRSRTAKDLAELARQNGVAGWHSMKKEQLIDALVAIARKRNINQNHTSDSSTNGHSITNHDALALSETPPHVRRSLEQLPVFIVIVALISWVIRDMVALQDRKEKVNKRNAAAGRRW